MFAVQKSAPGSRLKLSVQNGLHEGAVMPLGDDGIVIGSGDDCSAALWDSSVEGKSCQVELGRKGKALVTAVRGECHVGGRVIEEGASRSLSIDGVLKLGSVRLVLGRDDSSPVSANDNSPGMFPRLGVSALAVVGLLTVFVVVGAAGGWARVTSASSSLEADALPGLERRDVDARQALSQRLERSNLSNIALSVDGDGRILANGIVSVEQSRFWTDAKVWFDGRFGARSTLVDQVRDAQTEIVLPFEIVGVSDADTSSVFLHDGSRYDIGAILPGGWRLDDVSQKGVELSLGQQRVMVSF